MPNEPEPTEEELEERLRRLLGEAENADSDELDEIELKLQDIETKLTTQTEKRKELEGLFDAEFEEKLRALHEKADKVKNRHQEAKKEESRRQISDAQSARGAGVGLSIAYVIIGVPLVGAGIGWLINRQTGGTAWVGLLTTAGAVVGIVVALGIINRANLDGK